MLAVEVDELPADLGELGRRHGRPIDPRSTSSARRQFASQNDLGAIAFGDEPVVIYKGERLRWRNADSAEHNVVADTPSLPEFVETGALAPGGERTFMMNTTGTTRIHCSIHPQMVGTLIVRER